MGYAKGRFVVDGHVHAQRHAVKFKDKKIKPSFEYLQQEMPLTETFDNSDRLLYDMKKYDVDMCVILPANMYGMNNEINADLVKKYPDKFIATCHALETRKKAQRKEQEWTLEAACKELEELLDTGLYQGGIGEGTDWNPMRTSQITWDDRRKELRAQFDIARNHKVPISSTLVYGMVGYVGGGVKYPQRGAPEMFDPILFADLLPEYPDVPFIMVHGGMTGWWSEKLVEQVCYLAACFENAYIETGMYWADLYEKPLFDPNIGPSKLIWATDWGASLVPYSQPGKYPPSYINQVRSEGPPAYQVDSFGWALRQLDKAADKFELTQDDINLIIGGNACRIYKIETPFKRWFKE
jgi:predicted TIM-barrel fold metal-dependent hydrolase